MGHEKHFSSKLIHVVEKLVLDPFFEKLKLSLSLDLKFYTVCFYCMPSGGLSKYSETKLQTTCSYLKLSFFKKQKDVCN